MIEPFTAICVGVFGGVGSIIGSVCGGESLYHLYKTAPENLIMIKTYYEFRQKSQDADKIMEDFQVLKNNPYIYKNLNEKKQTKKPKKTKNKPKQKSQDKTKQTKSKKA